MFFSSRNSAAEEAAAEAAAAALRTMPKEPVMPPLDVGAVRKHEGDEYFVLERDEERGRVLACKARAGRSSWAWYGSGAELQRYRVFDPSDPDLAEVARLQAPGAVWPSAAESRATASFLGMPLGDALGSPMEFSAVRYDPPERWALKDMEYGFGNFGLRPGMWTDDASMGACIADSLLWRGRFDGYDMKLRFINWWNFGYNNAFRHNRSDAHSVGLGGNISMSFSEFQRSGAVYTTEGDANTCGNGSLMRNGAIPVFFHDNLPLAEAAARHQSYLTHQGTEAAECCALLTHLVVKAINWPAATPLTKEALLGPGNIAFVTECPSVRALANSEVEDVPPEKRGDRDWRWRVADQYRWSHSRATKQPGYVGSYAMDAIAMALHCVWSTDCFEMALLKAANTCGDADSVCSVTGQLAGALYGYEGIPQRWVDKLQQWDDKDFALRALKMFRRRPARYPGEAGAAAAALPMPGVGGAAPRASEPADEAAHARMRRVLGDSSSDDDFDDERPAAAAAAAATAPPPPPPPVSSGDENPEAPPAGESA